MTIFPDFFVARPSTDKMGREHLSLRCRYETSRLPGDRTSEFAKLYPLQGGGWSAWAGGVDGEDFGRALRAALVRAGKNAALDVVLAQIKHAYLEWHHPEEVEYERWSAALGDASGPGQDWDCRAA